MIQTAYAHTEEINFYHKTIRRYDVLTKEQEKALFLKIRQGDRDARIAIIMANQRFVYSEAKNNYARNESEIMDYVIEGNIGMEAAIDKFDENSGHKFFTFAVWYIKQAMTNYRLNKSNTLRQTNNAKLGSNVRRIRNRFILENQREPSVDEIKEILLKEKGIEIVNDRDLEDISLKSINDAYGEDGSFEDSKVFGIEAGVENEFLEEEEKEERELLVKRLLSTLDERSRTILMMSFGIGVDCAYDDEDIAEKFNLTKTRIGQIRNAALKKLKSTGISL